MLICELWTSTTLKDEKMWTLLNVTQTATVAMASDQISVTSSTPTPSDNDETIKLVWIIPTVIAIIVILVLLALGLFYCIRALEVAFIRHCAPRFSCCCACCLNDITSRDEYIHLNETFDIYKEEYTINGR